MAANETQHSTLLDGLIEAATAMRELPKVQADLEAAQSLASETETKLTAEQNKTALLQSTIDALRAEIASKEAALADATFRHDNLAKVVDAIRGALPQPVVPVAPEPAGSAAAVTEPVEAQGQSEQSPTSSTDHSASSTEPSLQTAPGTDVSAQENVAGTSNPAPAPEVAQPSPLPTSPTESSGTPVTEVGPSPTTNSGPSAAEDREPQGEAQSGPLLSAQQPESNTTQLGSNDKPYANAPYWRKPVGMTWAEWAAAGGEVPAWITDHNATD